MTSCCLLWSRHPEVRFHAGQSFYLGLGFVVMVAGLGLLEIFFGLVLPAFGRSVEYLAPAVAAVVAICWLSVVLRVVGGHPGRLPVIGHWAARRERKLSVALR